ncbi:MAG: OmpA family protein [Gemmatimonadota bacterium]|jgi:peptidoglycan-associated lipoprotein
MLVRMKSFAVLTATAVLGLSASACAHVTPKELDGRLQTLRDDLSQQIKEGDDQVASQASGRMDNLESRMDGLEADLNDLQQKYDVTVQKLEASLRFDVPVYFDFDKADIKARGQEVLQRFAQIAGKYYPEARITVEGFTDSSGSEAYNKILGQRRADAVKKFLSQEGLDAQRINAVSYGESSDRQIEPSQKGPGSNGWENRRVVLVIDHDGATTAASVASTTGEANR